ncbi:DUF1521 domain-containing protein [Sulfidibacter corallicola]|uniref:DUF1521 domain-containing protein n=1 Tax=Sulfidibacter corallicola TaxID=2818388 RepID=A0A8A4TQD3_SULCO|nr:DUF1521 domain-containing protein [Sulfidibacter corallicola]QTD51141.1 DUF1521 domain-containing protein [Sulfidibacter corallicola]
MIDGVNNAGMTELGLIEGGEVDLETLLMTLRLERANLINEGVLDQAREMKTINNKLKGANEALAALRVAESKAATPDEATWTVDKSNNEITLDGYKISLDESSSAWTIEKLDDNGQPTGEKTRIWGDPHVDEDGDRKIDWDFKKDTTFVLDDGTKISVGTKQWGNSDYTTSDTLTITKGDQAVVVTGLTQNDSTPLNISDVTLDGRQLDADTTDGHVVYEGSGVNQWVTANGTDLGNNDRQMHFETEAVATAETYQHKQVELDQKTLDFLKANNVTIVDEDGDGNLTEADIKATIENVKGFMDSVNATSQMNMIRLQSLNNKYVQAYDEATNFVKKFAGSKDSIIRNY